MMKQKDKILIFTYTDISRDPIVLNQINWLKDLYELHVICKLPVKMEGIKYHKYPEQSFIQRNLRSLLLKIRLYDLYTWNKGHQKLVKEVSNCKYALIIVHHIKLLPLAFAITPKAKILFHAHEYYMSMYDHSFWWRMIFKKYFIKLADEYIPRCAYLVTVNESIRDLYKNKYGIEADYLHNTTDYYALKPKEVDPSNIKILHHGLASTSRKLEIMIEFMKYLDKRYSLTLILQTNSIVNEFYIRKIKKLASGNPAIRFREIVKYDEIVGMGNEYDIGLFIMPPTTLNIKYSLGHKVFQFIQSRLMLVVTPLPEMKKLVDKYNLGVHTGDYDIKKLAAEMNTLTAEEIYFYKCQSDKHAKVLNSELSKKKYQEIISSLLP